jgi:hypothetical protein
VTEKQKRARSAQWTTRFLDFGRKVAVSYTSLQISHRGMYSIERLQAFEAYCEKTCAARALAVCVLTPVPSLLAIVLIECIPLCDPELGWQANYMFWLRFFLSGVVVAIGSICQVTDMIARVRLSVLQCIGVAVVSMAFYIATVLGVAIVWVFPVPFGVVLGIGPCFAILLAILILTIGLNVFKENPGLSQELKLQIYVLGTEGFIAVVYPALNSLYLKASPTSRAGLVLLMPLTKLIMKNIVARASSHLEDYVPVIAVFSIEVFNALYVATCMQATKSTLAIVVIIALDAINGALSFYSLLGRCRAIQQQQRLSRSTDSKAPGELLSTVKTASRQLRVFQTKTGKLIRVRAPRSLGLGADADHVLDSLLTRQMQLTRHGSRAPSRSASRPGAGSRGSASVQPKNDVKPLKLTAGPEWLLHQPTIHRLLQEQQRAELVESTLQLLFHCEYHALVEYVECAVPMLFGVYLSLVCQLPVHRYYPHTRDMAPGQLEGMLMNLLVYVAFEMLSFVAMNVALKRKFNMSALYQLAFVLETHMVQLQSRMFVWIVFTLQFTLQHYGVDFTFSFAWVR